MHMLGALTPPYAYASVPPKVTLGKLLRVFINDERTRTFLAVPLVGCDQQMDAGAFENLRQVLRAIGAVNKAFIMHGLQVYYKVSPRCPQALSAYTPPLMW